MIDVPQSRALDSTARRTPLETAVLGATLAVCAVFLAMSVFAAMSQPDGERVLTLDAVILAVSLCAALIPICWSADWVDRPMPANNQLVSVAAFAIVAGACAVAQAVGPRDGLSALMASVAVFALHRGRSTTGVAAAVIAIACSSFSVGVALVSGGVMNRTRDRILLPIGIIGLGLALAWLTHGPGASAHLEQVQRAPPQYVWTLASDLVKRAAPVIVLALFAVVFDALSTTATRRRAAGSRPAGAGALVPWLNKWCIISILLAAAWPRQWIGHAFVFLTPAFLLAARGHHVLSLLPLNRRDWTCSLLGLSCRAFVLWLFFKTFWFVLQAILAWTLL